MGLVSNFFNSQGVKPLMLCCAWKWNRERVREICKGRWQVEGNYASSSSSSSIFFYINHLCYLSWVLMGFGEEEGEKKIGEEGEEGVNSDGEREN